MPANALQRTRPSRSGCNRGVSCAGSLGRSLRRPYDETTIHIRESCLRFSRHLLLDGWRRTGDHRIHATRRESVAPCGFDFCGDRYLSFSQVSLLDQACRRVEFSTSENYSRGRQMTTPNKPAAPNPRDCVSVEFWALLARGR